MGLIEGLALEKGVSLSDVSIERSQEIFELCKDAVEIPSMSPKNRKRRLNQVSWITHVNELRKKNKM